MVAFFPRETSLEKYFLLLLLLLRLSSAACVRARERCASFNRNKTSGRLSVWMARIFAASDLREDFGFRSRKPSPSLRLSVSGAAAGLTYGIVPHQIYYRRSTLQSNTIKSAISQQPSDICHSPGHCAGYNLLLPKLVGFSRGGGKGGTHLLRALAV